MSVSYIGLFSVLLVCYHFYIGKEPVMSFEEFLRIYMEASDDARIQIEETLGSFEILFVSPEEGLDTSHIVQLLS